MRTISDEEFWALMFRSSEWSLVYWSKDVIFELSQAGIDVRLVEQVPPLGRCLIPTPTLNAIQRYAVELVQFQTTSGLHSIARLFALVVVFFSEGDALDLLPLIVSAVRLGGMTAAEQFLTSLYEEEEKENAQQR